MANSEKSQRKGRGSNPNSKANLKMFVKGQSGNPKGPEPGYVQRRTQIRKWADFEMELETPTGKLMKGTLEDHGVIGTFLAAGKGNPSALKEIMDSLYGKLEDTSNTNVTVKKIEVEFIDGDE